MEKQFQGALSDITVLDMTRVLSGPFAATWLGEMGANVIKIEIPKGGDESRRNPPFNADGTSAFNTTVNRNKRSITLDLKSEEGKEIFRQLVKQADVVLENFRPDVMDRLGLGYEELKKINDQLFDSAYNANKYSNILGPVNAQLGNVSYVLCATVGGYLAINGIGGFTLGSLASYLTLNRNFMMPINQMTSQINSILLGLAGAQRIFAIIDQEPEADNGYVTLVNAKRDENGEITECSQRTGLWAWRHPHQADGTVTYTELKGDITMDSVDFGYNEEKQVLFDVSLYARPGQKLAFVGGQLVVIDLESLRLAVRFSADVALQRQDDAVLHQPLAVAHGGLDVVGVHSGNQRR